MYGSEQLLELLIFQLQALDRLFSYIVILYERCTLNSTVCAQPPLNRFKITVTEQNFNSRQDSKDDIPTWLCFKNVSKFINFFPQLTFSGFSSILRQRFICSVSRTDRFRYFCNTKQLSFTLANSHYWTNKNIQYRQQIREFPVKSFFFHYTILYGLKLAITCFL